jgi:hypothetical protein
LWQTSGLENGQRAAHIVAMAKTLLALSTLTVLAGCSGYSSAKQREICTQAYRDDKPKIDQCVAVADREAARDAWTWFKTGAR